MWNIPFNGLSIAEGGITTDKICADPRLAGGGAGAHASRSRARRRAFGSSFRTPFLQKQFDVTPPMGAYQPSSLVDYLAGREVEVEAIWGEPLRRAQAAGVAMPRLSALYSVLLEKGGRDRAPLIPR